MRVDITFYVSPFLAPRNQTQKERECAKTKKGEERKKDTIFLVGHLPCLLSFFFFSFFFCFLLLFLFLLVQQDRKRGLYCSFHPLLSSFHSFLSCNFPTEHTLPSSTSIVNNKKQGLQKKKQNKVNQLQ